MAWTLFWDMHSGGGCKEDPFDKIYIEAPEAEARVIFFNRFGHNADRISCTCCGADYSVEEYETLEEASLFHRGGARSKPQKEGIPVEEYIERDTVLVITASEITDQERVGDVPEQGWVWS